MFARPPRWLAVAIAAAASALVLSAPTAQAAQPTCTDERYPVTIAGLAQTMAGTLCVPAGGASAVQVLVPGGFYTVFLGGHSLGSAISIIEAATYRDVDGVLVTGMGHHLNVLGLAPIAATFVPAVLDPAVHRPAARPRLPHHDARHALDYAPNAPDLHDVVVRWADRMIPR